MNPEKSKVIFLLCFVFEILAVVSVGTALLTPWYSAHIETNAFTVDYNYTLFEERTNTSGPYSSFISFGQRPYNKMQETDPNFVGVMNTTLGMMIIALIVAILFIVFVIINSIKKIYSKVSAFLVKEKMIWVTRTLGILAMVFMLIAPIFMMIALPPAMKEDSKKGEGTAYIEPAIDHPTKSFFGSCTGETIFGAKAKGSWGGATGWFLSLAGFVFALIATFLLFFVTKKELSSVSPQVENPASVYQKKRRFGNYVLVWGMFLIAISMPFILLVTLLYDFGIIIFYSWIICIFILFLFDPLYNFFINKSKFGFWIENRKAWQSYFDEPLALVGPGLAMGVMLIYWFLFLFFPLAIAGDTIIQAIATVIMAFLCPYIIFRFSRRGYTDVRYLKLKTKDEAFIIMEQALSSLHLKYERIISKSKWAVQQPKYQIAGLKITVQVSQINRKEVIITIETNVSEEVPRMKEIEKSIDTALTVSGIA